MARITQTKTTYRRRRGAARRLGASVRRGRRR